MKKFLLIVALSLLLAGCGETLPSEATPSPTATLAPVPTATQAATLVPTAKLVPIQTPTPSPTATLAPVPTATPTPLSVQQKIANAIQADQAAVSFCFIIAGVNFGIKRADSDEI